MQQQRGDAAESIAEARLSAAGWQVFGRRVRIGRREVDLVALDPGPPARLVAVEVRWRASRSFGLPEETLDRSKRRHLRAAVLRICAAGRLPDGTVLPRAGPAVDLIVVEPPAAPGSGVRMRHHRNVVEG